MQKKVNVLFTSVGRRVELLESFRSAYRELNIEGNIIGTDIDPLAPAFQVVNRGYLVPRTNSKNFISKIIEICETEAISVIFPLIDQDIPVLANNCKKIEPINSILVVVSKRSAEISADKWATYHFFKNIDVPTCKSWLPDEISDSELHFPLFIKPRSGSASKDAFKVESDKELSFFLEYIKDPIIQEYLPGPEITNDVVCDLSGEILGICSRQRLEVRWGEVAKGITVMNKEIIDGCIAVAKGFEAIGPITVQCMMKDGTAYFTEINARFGGGLPLSIAAGVDAPKWLLAKLANIPVEIPPVGKFEVGLYVTRHDNSFFLTKQQLDEIKDNTI